MGEHHGQTIREIWCQDHGGSSPRQQYKHPWSVQSWVVYRGRGFVPLKTPSTKIPDTFVQWVPGFLPFLVCTGRRVNLSIATIVLWMPISPLGLHTRCTCMRIRQHRSMKCSNTGRCKIVSLCRHRLVPPLVPPTHLPRPIPLLSSALPPRPRLVPPHSRLAPLRLRLISRQVPLIPRPISLLLRSLKSQVTVLLSMATLFFSLCPHFLTTKGKFANVDMTSLAFFLRCQLSLLLRRSTGGCGCLCLLLLVTRRLCHGLLSDAGVGSCLTVSTKPF